MFVSKWIFYRQVEHTSHSATVSRGRCAEHENAFYDPPGLFESATYFLLKDNSRNSPDEFCGQTFKFFQLKHVGLNSERVS
jgi:hypothetical protein